jgi:hypothetical protein
MAMKKSVDLSLPVNGDHGMNVVGASPGKPSYPTLRLYGKDELHLPDDGVITFCYHRKSETSSETEDGDHRYECVLEIQSLENVKPIKEEKNYTRDTGAEDSLDKLMKEKEAAAADDDDGDEGY